MNRIIAILTMIICLSCGVTAQERTDILFPTDSLGGEELTVSIVTCDPGPDVYELCGHAAIRIRSAQMDSVWNYGIFDFTSPNFIYRFCKGETDYMVYGYKFDLFLPVYARRGSTVRELVLNLSQNEARRLRSLLQTESLPQNRVYRYNYVRDNCATRPWKRVTQATDREILLPDTLYYPTFRSEMRHFHRNYPWYQFGIDLVLGSGLDYPLAKDEDTFAPPVLADKLAAATIGGEPLVRRSDIIFPGFVDPTLPPTPWWRTPMALGVMMLLLSLGTMFAYIFKKSLWRWWICIYFLAAGIAGCIVTFLVFFSEHEATSPNILIWWLNPFQLLIAVGIWWKRWRKPVAFMAAFDLVMSVVLTLVLAVNISPQRVNPASWPMLMSIIPLSIPLLLSNRTTYNVQRKTQKNE